MDINTFNRRDMFKVAGFSAAAAGFWPSMLAKAATPESNQDPDLLKPFIEPEITKPARPVTAIVIGAGGRGNVYARYAVEHPDEFKIVGVAEPLEYRNSSMAKAHSIPDENRFVTWEDVFKKPKLADVCLICTPDNLHYGPAMAALKMGYDLLLEKPIAQTWTQCKDILNLAEKNDRIVAVCHVLRYTPYYQKMKEVVSSGYIGDVVSIQHLEAVYYPHMITSYVRGNWRNTKETNPILLAKSCHDLDIIRWVTDQPCKKLNSFGSLTLFRKEMAPQGSAPRCKDCPLESTCAFSAYRMYVREKLYSTSRFQIPDQKPDTVRKELDTGPYGRCVYFCDNDACDHQTVNMQFGNNITVVFSVEGLSSKASRFTRIMGTEGDIVGDLDTGLNIFNFATRKRTMWNVKDFAKDLGGHSGGDTRLVRDFVQAVTKRDPSLLKSTLKVSMESHLIGFEAEKSRLSGGQLRSIKI